MYAAGDRYAIPALKSKSLQLFEHWAVNRFDPKEDSFGNIVDLVYSTTLRHDRELIRIVAVLAEKTQEPFALEIIERFREPSSSSKWNICLDCFMAWTMSHQNHGEKRPEDMSCPCCQSQDLQEINLSSAAKYECTDCGTAFSCQADCLLSSGALWCPNCGNQIAQDAEEVTDLP
jgi:DNA-directed RNA polymerase subunit RPC12/RpoP